MKALVIIMLLLNACGQHESTSDRDLQERREAVLEDLRIEFIQDCFEYDNERCIENNGNNQIFAVRKDSMGNHSGECDPDNNTVYIDEKFLKDYHFLKVLVYHELGHCLLGAKHDTSNVMKSTFKGDAHDSDTWDFYKRELFQTNQ